MTNNSNFRYQVFKKASLARNFEEEVSTTWVTFYKRINYFKLLLVYTI